MSDFDSSEDAPKSVLNCHCLRKLFEASREARDAAVMEILEASTSAVPHTVELRAGVASERVGTADLLFATAAGRFRPDALAACRVIEFHAEDIPAEDGARADALAIVVRLIKNQSTLVCPAKLFGPVLRVLNFIAAEPIIHST